MMWGLTMRSSSIGIKETVELYGDREVLINREWECYRIR